ncbi:MAG: hypothetical protein AAF696_06685 [Bacteroidota bacterium]
MRAFLKSIFLFTLPLLLMPLMIYEVDPFGIFREDFSQQVVEPNQRYVKMKWLSEEKRAFDSFIFGSSKVGNIDSRKFVGGKYYNMTYSMGLPYEWMEDMKQLDKTGYEIKNIVICLDEFSYTRTHDQNSSFLRKPYHQDWGKRLEFQAKYLLRMPNFSVLHKAYYPFNKDKEFLVNYDIKATGIPFKTERETYVEEHMDIHRTDWKFDIDWPLKLPRMDESLYAIKEIKQFCESKGIELQVVYLPVYHKKLKDVKTNKFEEYKEAIAEITDYWDFSEVRPIIDDRQYWFEQVHFRAKVGDMIVGKLNGAAELADFGKLVSRKGRNLAKN